VFTGRENAMKVLHVIDAMNCGGAQRVLETLVPVLNARPGQVHAVAVLFSHRRFPWAFPPEVALTFLGAGYWALPILPLRLRRVLANFEPDIVHIHLAGSRFVTAAALMLWRGQPRVVWHEHSGDALQERYGTVAGALLRRIEGWLARGVSAVIAVSEHAATGLEHRWRTAVHVIHNPIDVERIRDAARQAVVDVPPGVRPDATAVLFAGRLSSEKGPDLFLHVAEELAPRHPDWQFWIVGDGALRARLKAEAAKAKLANRVFFWGVRKDVYAIMRHASTLAITSRRESFVLVALEALALGTPVVAFESLGIVSELRGHRCVRFVPPGDVEAFAQAVEMSVVEGSSGTVDLTNYCAENVGERITGIYTKATGYPLNTTTR
jgi:GalNAc-alpha-(1->4)-GalNAc-alpha-(1->3)-diNAcBac-PP-undecaprenol alpha-1,4-N-acetyl-D-galactosaminyltransferase